MRLKSPTRISPIIQQRHVDFGLFQAVKPNKIRRNPLPAIRCSCVKIESPHTVEPVARQNAAATELLVKGMTCGNCARHVTEAIQGVSGVRSATVSLENKNATVRWNPGATANVPAVIAALKNAGYEAKEIQADASGASCSCMEAKHKRWQWNLILGIAVTVLLMIGEWVFNLAMTPWFQWLSFALAGAVQIFAGAQFYRGAWNQLKIGNSNMDTLVALGSTTAFGYSAWALLTVFARKLWLAKRRRRSSVFHGSRRHHHAHQRSATGSKPA